MPTLDEQQLSGIYDFAVQLGKDAGSMLQKAANERIAGTAQTESVEKASAVDIVTETDEGEWSALQVHLSRWPKLRFDYQMWKGL